MATSLIVEAVAERELPIHGGRATLGRMIWLVTTTLSGLL
jgi:hypothetical protein